MVQQLVRSTTDSRRRFGLIQSLVVAFSVALLSQSAFSDELVFKNGDKLSGEIKSMAEGKITLVTRSMGEIEVPVEALTTMSTTKPIELHFNDGTVITQVIQASDAGRVAIADDEILESQSFLISDFAAINPPPSAIPTWTGSIAASAAWTAGNAETRTGTIDIEAFRRTELDRIGFDAHYVAGRQRSPGTGDFVTTERRISAALKYDYFFTKQLYGWSKISAEKDAIAAIDLRLIAGAGVGYQWWEKKRSAFSTDLGLTWFSENYANTTPDTDTVTARVAYRFDKRLSDRLRMFNEVEWFPSLEDSKDHYVIGVIGLRANLTDSMFGNVRFNIDWDSTPANGAERTDVLYTVGLGWTF